MSNTITQVLPKLLAQGLLALRQNAIMPQLVNRSYESMAAQKGNVINIPIPSAVIATNVVPGPNPVSNQDFSPTAAQVTLDFWKEATFQLSDSDMVAVMDGTIPMQASEAIKVLGNAIDAYIISKHTGLFGKVGTPGTTPFGGSLLQAGQARTMLNKQLAPLGDRRCVIDPDAEGNLLLTPNILQFDQRGDQGGIINGAIGTKLGFDWYMDQNMGVSFTPGNAATNNASWTFDASNQPGIATLGVVYTGSGTINKGDIFALATGGLGYVVTASVTVATGVTQQLSFYPPLRATAATGATLVWGGTTAYAVNLAFHRDAMAWASRPLQDIAGLGNAIQSASDPISGVALRLEVSRQNRQTTFAFDVLGGANVIRPELAVKVIG